MNVETLSQAFLNTIRAYVKPDIMMVKKEGRYTPISTADFAADVRAISMGLRSIGLRPGDKFIIFSENRPEWVMTDFAGLCQGAVPVPIYTSLLPDQVRYIISDSDARFVFCSGTDLLAKIQAIRSDLPQIERIIAFDPVDNPDVMPLDRLKRLGRELDARDPEAFEKTALSVRPDDLASIVYTSGTTGVPKGVMLTHANFVSNTKALDASIEFTDRDVILSFLPLSHVLERMTTFSFLYKGSTIAYAESIETVADNLVEVRPTIMISVPRLFDKFYARVMDNVLSQSALKRKIFFWALNTGKKYSSKKLNKERIPAWLAWERKLAYKLALHKIVERTGGRVRFFVSGGAPLSSEIAQFFYGVGITICEGYGLTETAPVLTFNNFEKVKLGTVGVPVPGVELKIAGDGEILAKGPNVMRGYYKLEQETKEVLKDGWFHTGDVGYIDEDGFLVITDRKKDLIVTAGGKNVAPQPIENMIKNNPYVLNAVIVGNGRKFVSALIVPDFDKLEDYARSKGIGFSARRELIDKKEIVDFMLEQVGKSTPNLASFETVKKVVLLDRDFEQELDELTPTLKVRRKIVEDNYKSVIDSIYRE